MKITNFTNFGRITIKFATIFIFCFSKIPYFEKIKDNQLQRFISIYKLLQLQFRNFQDVEELSEFRILATWISIVSQIAMLKFRPMGITRKPEPRAVLKPSCT